jgi:hypothetical protein
VNLIKPGRIDRSPQLEESTQDKLAMVLRHLVSTLARSVGHGSDHGMHVQSDSAKDNDEANQKYMMPEDRSRLHEYAALRQIIVELAQKFKQLENVQEHRRMSREYETRTSDLSNMDMPSRQEGRTTHDLPSSTDQRQRNYQQVTLSHNFVVPCVAFL